MEINILSVERLRAQRSRGVILSGGVHSSSVCREQTVHTHTHTYTLLKHKDSVTERIDVMEGGMFILSSSSCPEREKKNHSIKLNLVTP